MKISNLTNARYLIVAALASANLVLFQNCSNYSGRVALEGMKEKASVTTDGVPSDLDTGGATVNMGDTSINTGTTNGQQNNGTPSVGSVELVNPNGTTSMMNGSAGGMNNADNVLISLDDPTILMTLIMILIMAQVITTLEEEIIPLATWVEYPYPMITVMGITRITKTMDITMVMIVMTLLRAMTIIKIMTPFRLRIVGPYVHYIAWSMKTKLYPKKSLYSLRLMRTQAYLMAMNQELREKFT